MRLEITCEDRLGLCQEILAILRENEIDLRGIEVDPVGKIYLNFPALEFADFQELMPKIRRIPNVEDVKTTPYMPSEREHYEFNMLLSTLPNPVISVDAKGHIDVINSAGAALLNQDKSELKGAWVDDWLGGYSVVRWLEKKPQEATTAQVKCGRSAYYANILPIWLTDEDGEPSFAGAVIHCQSEPVGIPSLSAQGSAAFSHILTQHSGFRRILKDAERMAGLEVPLLIEGETGVGKELIARACHKAGSRSEAAFLAVNCGALPDNVAESELFGYGAGIFNNHPEGKKGIFEQADGGTVLLDSVGDMSPELQAKLLRFIQHGSFRRIGEEAEVSVDVRIICSARGSLMDPVESGDFREDLYYRLNVLSLNLPPLRERKGDVLLLAEHFLQQSCQRLGRPLVRMSSACQNYLTQYNWPGNIRQLENTLFRSVSLADGELLEPQDIHLPELPPISDSLDIDLDEASLEEAVKSFEASMLRRLYPSYPSTRQLARKLGLSHTAIANKLREYGIGKQRRRD
ncbi:transcriptional regulator TyrR [Aliidiomarina minuta]|uniref:HTH-type transcriptional regulatory protein TyrR n=1 Tax=Aliidiomarina minuta TaxID=880057 RepID=A0A432W6U8_9GAMM|nr:transcriptional regulator TyrR [Aliidiomarina minuta]RUO25788.1 transcriptional regulator TyrR [Aliidiomarina minuta]